LAQLKREAENKAAPQLREKLYQTHIEMFEAIRAQELEMQHLSDIIPALDMVHSSLISSISIDPVRLQSHQSTAQPKVPLMSAASFEVLSVEYDFLRAIDMASSVSVIYCTRPLQRQSQALKLEAGVQGISLSSSLRGLPPARRQSVPVRCSIFTEISLVSCAQRQSVPIRCSISTGISLVSCSD
jgi:hypothetical protein